MRLTDSPQVECEIEIAADLGRVWELVSDISTSVRHSPELQEVEWLDGAVGPGVGASFTGRNRNAGLGEWQTVSRIVEMEPMRTFRWEVVYYHDRDHGDPLSVWTYSLEPVEDGTRTRLRHGMRLGTARGPLQEFIERNPEQEERILDGRFARLRVGIETTLAGVKSDAEA
ncbi:SRPBCC family protein [Streptomyces sp. NBC_01465]|uniref:SRPBCC family protein n=1 Tax=Streptomyces sp. NBC_01465 TaxID=2903878 RepID=UPI002E37B6CA|nr:SRPBCC family protein [Streptomyces sp. NBC_01465]